MFLTNVKTKNWEIHRDELKLAPFHPKVNMESDGFNNLVSTSKEFCAPPGIIYVRPYTNHYQIIAGAENYYAFKEAFPHSNIPCSQLYLEEDNLIRFLYEHYLFHGYLDFVSTGLFYDEVMTFFDISAMKLSHIINIKESTISKSRKSAKLSEPVVQEYRNGNLSAEHAKYLCSVPKSEQMRYVRKVINDHLTSRELYKLLKPETKWKDLTTGKQRTETSDANEALIRVDEHTKHSEEQLSNVINAPVDLRLDSDNFYKGKAVIDFYSLEELEGIIEKLASRTKHPKCWKGRVVIDVDSLSQFNDMIDGVIGEDEYY